MPFINENVAAGLPVDDKFQIGKSNFDNLGIIEKTTKIPWASDPAGSYVYYDCTIEVMLDSGIAIHNQLPQSDPSQPANLSANTIDQDNFDTINNIGVNLNCQDQYEDIKQRMGHARFWFRLWGEALRIGYQVPIPSIKKIGGVDAVPYDKNPQWAFNKIAPGANYGGVILWWARWSLWYTTLVPPTTNTIPIANMTAHISADVPPPKDMQVPYTQPDDEAQPNNPRRQRPPIGGFPTL